MQIRISVELRSGHFLSLLQLLAGSSPLLWISAMMIRCRNLCRLFYVVSCCVGGRRFAAALLPRLFGTNPRSHHKGATGRVRTGDQRLPVLCHCQLGQDIPGTCEMNCNNGSSWMLSDELVTVWWNLNFEWESDVRVAWHLTRSQDSGFQVSCRRRSSCQCCSGTALRCRGNLQL